MKNIDLTHLRGKDAAPLAKGGVIGLVVSVSHMCGRRQRTLREEEGVILALSGDEQFYQGIGFERLPSWSVAVEFE